MSPCRTGRHHRQRRHRSDASAQRTLTRAENRVGESPRRDWAWPVELLPLLEHDQRENLVRMPRLARIEFVDEPRHGVCTEQSMLGESGRRERITHVRLEISLEPRIDPPEEPFLPAEKHTRRE